MENKEEVPKAASAQSANAPTIGNDNDMPDYSSRVPAISVTQQEVIDLGNTSLLDANMDQLSNILEGGEQNNKKAKPSGTQ